MAALRRPKGPPIMRNHALVLAALCLLATPAAAMQSSTPKPSAPKAEASKPAAPKAEAKERKEIKVTEKLLKAYAGEYQLDAERSLTFALENGSLWGGPTGQTKHQLFAESQTKFFLKDLPIDLTFKKDAKGTVTGLTMEQTGRPTRELKKVK
jgi:hypothetical protein